MEQYYFLQRNGNIQGPYSLVDLKKHAVQTDDLVCRNNTSKWVKASDLEELSEFIVIASSVFKTKIDITELYYFIQQEGSKKGPFKLPELKKLTIYFDELVWRSDSDQWKKASEFEELSSNFIIKPPPTPKEQKIAEVNQNFIGQIIGYLAIFYVIASLLIGFISYSLAQSSWDKYLKETGGKYLGEKQVSGRGPLISEEQLKYILDDIKRNPKTTKYDLMQAYSDASDFRTNGDMVITAKERDDNKRYEYYTPGINNETSLGYGQGFWFRPFKAFGSTIYLTLEEQKNYNLLMGHLILSSFASLSLIFMILGVVYYAIKRTV